MTSPSIDIGSLPVVLGIAIVLLASARAVERICRKKKISRAEYDRLNALQCRDWRYDYREMCWKRKK